MNELTTSNQDYLEIIYILSKITGYARSVDVANALKVSRASVNKAINALVEKKYLTHEKYSDLKLTQSGINEAKTVLERHEFLYNFFHNILNVNEENSRIDACKTEHILSEESYLALKEFLKKYN